MPQLQQPNFHSNSNRLVVPEWDGRQECRLTSKKIFATLCRIIESKAQLIPHVFRAILLSRERTYKYLTFFIHRAELQGEGVGLEEQQE